MANIIPQNSPKTPEQIYNETNLANEDACPWVQLGNLFVSVTTTGNKSWRPVVRSEYMRGYRDFTLLTGRHGNQFGQEVDLRGAFGPGVADLAHYNQDVVEAGELTRRLDGAQIEVIDVGQPPYDSVVSLKQLALEKLRTPRIVIFAWCFSIFSMREYPGGGLVPDSVLRSYMMKAWTTSVAVHTRETFEWVPARRWPVVQPGYGFRSPG
jgi:hypothetical protein